MDLLLRAAGAIALAHLPQAAPEGRIDPVGDWAGWLYMDDGDVPLRLHVSEGAAGLEARVDLPAAGQIGIAFDLVVREDELLLGHPSVAEAGARVAVDLRGGSGGEDHARGSVEWFGVGGRVELHRAGFPLEWETPEEAAGLVGVYGDPPGLVVWQQPWGEPVLVDPARGDERTLFPRADGSHVVGPAHYVPAPIEREIVFERDGEGVATALVQRIRGGAPRRLERRAIAREEIRVERDGVPLAGTLLVPDGDPVACAVLAGGSDWRLRSEVEPFALLLAAHGAGSIAYDKRGHGASEGDAVVPFDVTAADLRAFATAAREHPSVDPRRVGYLGISRGGWYGALAASTDADCAFFVDVVGPAVSPVEQETTARLDRMRERGASDADRALAERYLRAMWRFGRTEVGGERYLELREAVDAAGWLPELRGPDTLEPAQWRWTRLNGDFDPRPALRKLHRPALALYGEEDLAVAARVNAPLARDALWASEAEDVRVLVLPGCDHSLRPVLRDPDGRRLPHHRSPGRHPEVWRALGTLIESLPSRR